VAFFDEPRSRNHAPNCLELLSQLVSQLLFWLVRRAQGCFHGCG
jgi:hypothetical protein